MSTEMCGNRVIQDIQIIQIKLSLLPVILYKI